MARKRTNGEGTVYKHKNRKSPYEAKITLGYKIDPKTDKCKQEFKFLGYFETYSEAANAIEAYKKSNDLDCEKDHLNYTFEDIYKFWYKNKFDDLENTDVVRKRKNGYKSAWLHFEPLYNERWIDYCSIQGVKKIKKVFTNSSVGYPTIRRMHSLLTQLNNHAKDDLKISNYPVSEYLVFDEKITSYNPHKIERNAFDRAEINKIFATNDPLMVDTFKILIYTGVRINELLKLKKEDIDLDNKELIIRESKTDAGKNRLIPIHAEIYDIIARRLKDTKCEYIIYTEKGNPFTYSNFSERAWKPFMNALGLEKHRPHDTRHTFKTYWDFLGLKERACELILGHKSQNVRKVYNRSTREMLEIEMKGLTFNYDLNDSKLLEKH